jgi:hypothetical protein
MRNGIIGAVGLEEEGIAQFDHESIRPRAFAFSTFL